MNTMNEKYWCIADGLSNILKSCSVPPKVKITDVGVGLAWSRHWQIIAINHEARAQADWNGVAVWFYPESAREEYLSWFSRYIEQKIQDAITPHKSQAPVMPEIFTTQRTRFDNKTICFTGFYTEDKKRIETFVTVHNISTKKSISKKIDFVITGPNAFYNEGKIPSAVALAIPVISAETFLDEISK